MIKVREHFRLLNQTLFCIYGFKGLLACLLQRRLYPTCAAMTHVVNDYFSHLFWESVRTALLDCELPL